MAPSSFPAFSRKCTPSEADVSLCSAFLCALFLFMPYEGWIPALICAFAGALFAPATAALKGLDFGLIPTMLWGFMAGMAAYPGVVLPQAAQPEDEPEG